MCACESMVSGQRCPLTLMLIISHALMHCIRRSDTHIHTHAQLMQNFGKADKTTDELFEIYSNNFNKQQHSATRLAKEMKNYVTCLRGLYPLPACVFAEGRLLLLLLFLLPFPLPSLALQLCTVLPLPSLLLPASIHESNDRFLRNNHSATRRASPAKEGEREACTHTACACMSAISEPLAAQQQQQAT